MKNIIILGEEYWFQQEELSEATYLLEYLENKRNKKYNYIILKSPSELITTINTLDIKTIKALLLFQDVLSDSYLNKKNIKEMKSYLFNLIKNNIHIYPNPNIIDIFASKQYNLTLKKQLPWAQLPHTEVYNISNYAPYQEKIIIKKLYEYTTKLWETFSKVVIKKGYSYEGKQVKIFNKDNNKDFKDFKDKAEKLNYKKFWGIGSNSIKIDSGITRYYIIQGFNKIVSKRINEYRVFFYNGKAKYIANGTNIPNKCLKDIKSVPLGKEIVKFAKKLYKNYIPIFWKDITKYPILFRIDVSFAIDDEFQDEYSIKIEGFEKPVRIYANEIEIDPTNFFFNQFICLKDDKISNKEIQEGLGKAITKYIKKLDKK
jgi:hypothetical protein